MMDSSTLRCNATELSEGVEKAIWEMLHMEAMHTGLDLEDKDTVTSVAKALVKVADELIKEFEDA
jgi:hypothetical protein